MAVMSKQDPSPVFVETVQEIMRLYRSLPPRPSIEEVAAAKSVLKIVENEEKSSLRRSQWNDHLKMSLMRWRALAMEVSMPWKRSHL
ncbi:hypothetical protein GOBAR_AA00265 [Gossypium barbadense]|uniref:Uncharacterized protein n=1 Tax=Gossypium barbadense TaxID=3634 RepID=A0A2P5YXJ4_GOSBA|nr:hypothetical protein GOBAR_AA00265 [Gossypium barbadense]